MNLLCIFDIGARLCENGFLIWFFLLFQVSDIVPSEFFVSIAEIREKIMIKQS
jgi:hypothetical protein